MVKFMLWTGFLDRTSNLLSYLSLEASINFGHGAGARRQRRLPSSFVTQIPTVTEVHGKEHLTSFLARSITLRNRGVPEAVHTFLVPVSSTR